MLCTLNFETTIAIGAEEERRPEQRSQKDQIKGNMRLENHD